MVGSRSRMIIVSLLALCHLSFAIPVLTPEQGWGGSGSRTRRAAAAGRVDGSSSSNVVDNSHEYHYGYSQQPEPPFSSVDSRHHYQDDSIYPYHFQDLSLGAVAGPSSFSPISSYPEQNQGVFSHGWQVQQGDYHDGHLAYQQEQMDEEESGGEGEQASSDYGQEVEGSDEGFEANLEEGGEAEVDDQEKGVDDDDESNVNNARPSDFYTKANIQQRREKVFEAWKEEGLNFVDFDPEALAVKVRNLVVEGVPHKSVLIQSAKWVVKEAPKWYSERYLAGQVWLTEKIADRKRLQRNTEWKANNKRYKMEKRKQQQDERYAGIIAELQSQNLLDLSLPVDHLEFSTRGLQTVELLPIVCTRAIKWYLEHYRSPEDCQAFVKARSKVRYGKRGGGKPSRGQGR